jgi:hypothetical protein
MAVIIGMVFGGTVGLVVCGVTAGAGWAMAVGDGLPMARFVGFVADLLTNVWRLRSKRTLTNRCLPISIYEYTPSWHDAGRSTCAVNCTAGKVLGEPLGRGLATR